MKTPSTKSPAVGKKYLITLRENLLGPDWVEFGAIYGTIRKIFQDDDLLGYNAIITKGRLWITIGRVTLPMWQVAGAIELREMRESPHVLDADQAETEEGRLSSADEIIPAQLRSLANTRKCRCGKENSDFFPLCSACWDALAGRHDGRQS